MVLRAASCLQPVQLASGAGCVTPVLMLWSKAQVIDRASSIVVRTAGSGGGGGATGFAAIVSEAQFNQMFPNRNPFYSYAGLVEAAKTYPAFAGTGDRSS